MSLLLTALVAGAGVGAVYALIALSYNVVFTSTGTFNLAQGDLMMLGVLVSYISLRVAGMGQLLTLVLVVLVVVAVSLFEEAIAVAPFLRAKARGTFGWFISTLAFSVILANVIRNVYGTKPITTIPSFIQAPAFNVGSMSIAPRFAIAIGLLIIVTIGLELFYRRTPLGVVMRGVSEDQEAAEIRGVSLRRTSRTAFAIAGLVTGLAAFVVAPIVATDFSVGLLYALKGFIALAIAGFGSIRGCALGGLVLGILEQVCNLVLGTNFEVFAGLVAVLLLLSFRPSGLFSSAKVRLV